MFFFGKKSSSPPPPAAPAPVSTPVAPKANDQPVQRVTPQEQERAATAPSNTTLLPGTPEDEALKRQQQAGVLMG